MRKWVFQTMDRVVIHLASLVVHESSNPQADAPRLAEELESRAYVKKVWPAANLSFISKTDFQFPTALQSRWSANNTVPGRLFRAAGGSESLVILAHGLGGEIGYKSLFPLLAKRMNSRGVDTGMILLPYHGERRPSGKGARGSFITNDLNGMLEAVWQGVGDFSALIGWARANGYKRVALWGFSLGSLVTGLVASGPHAPEVLTLAIPVAEMEEAIATLKFCAPVKAALGGARIPLEHLDLRANPPRTARENILVTECVWDLFAPPGSVQRLVKAWHGVNVQGFMHSHISIFFSPWALGKLADWTCERLRAGS